MQRGRRARVEVEYDGQDITNEINSGLVSLTYSDNTDKADDVQLEFDDRTGNWRGPWYPKVAAKETEE